VVVEHSAAYGRVEVNPFHLRRLGVNNVLIVVRDSQINQFTGVTQANRRQSFHRPSFDGQQHFVDVGKRSAFALRSRLALGQVVSPSTMS